MREYISYDWFTVFVFVGVLAIVFAKLLYALRFNDFISIGGNSKYLKIYTKGYKLTDMFNGLLFINFTISTGIFLFFCFSEYINPLRFNLISFLYLLLVIVFFISIKHFLTRMLATVFNIEFLIEGLVFQKITFLNYSGILLIISNALLLYATINAKWVIIFSLILLSIINLFGFVSVFKKHQNLLISNFFYFLLYLCALEISPYVLLFKVISCYNI